MAVLRVCGLGLMGLLGCSGPSFTSADPVEETADGGHTVVEAGVVADARGEAALTKSDVAPSPCGALRSGAAPNFERELCFEPSSFTMGSNAPNLGSVFADHTPPHTVTLHAFALDAYEVTVARYRGCVAAGACAAPPAGTGCSFEGSDAERPITCVSWEDAKKFCAWDGTRRLPSEAEWERAARGSGASDYPWGTKFDCSHAVLGAANSCPEYAGELPLGVGQAAAGASPEGALDLAGNAAEWVADWVGSYPVGTLSDPRGPSGGSQRVVRGGGWRSMPEHGMGYVRSSAAPEARGAWGFRCARDP
jgi:formylglycine-generating enzyme required for sulfatase activity